MKKFTFVLILALIANFMLIGAAFADVSEQDVKEAIKITEKLRKLSDRNDIEGIKKYYSDNYKSHDGYNKDQIMEIFETARKLYPSSKTKETIKKVDVEGDLIKIYIDEISTTKFTVKGEDASYTENGKIKGKMVSSADYSMTYKKENDSLVVVADEIFSEVTDIRYGEAMDADFKMEAPKTLKPKEEFTVKTTLIVPEDRVAVGSIGHDKIVYPVEKYWDPYRAIDATGILERVMIANNDNINEYANATYAFIKTAKAKKGEKKKYRAVISGMGFYVQRMNMEKTKNENKG